MTLRFFNKRVFFTLVSILALTVITAIGGLVYYLNSPHFTARIRQSVVRELEQRTGTEVSLGDVQWSFRQQRFVFEDLTLRGLEPPDGAPLARIDTIAAGLNFRSLFNRHLDLSELVITRPQFFLLIDEEGRTNVPERPPQEASTTAEFRVSIGDFQVIDGRALINENHVDINFAVTDLSSTLHYQDATRILSMDTEFNGSIARRNAASIPYKMVGKLAYSSGHLLAHEMEIRSGKSTFKAQGRIDNVFSKSVAGKLEYAASAEAPFLNYFLPREKVSGMADLDGFLEFANGYFFTSGNAKSAALSLDDWKATKVRTSYTYHYPERRLALRNLSASALDGTASGNITVDPVPGSLPRFQLDLEYDNIDSALLAHVAPWNPRYRLFSRVSGNLHGWFEGRIENYELDGSADLAGYAPLKFKPMRCNCRSMAQRASKHVLGCSRLWMAE